VQSKILNRFWSKVDKSGDCWEWTGYRERYGYGRVSMVAIGMSNKVLAHRAAWILTHGEIPSGMNICHTCDNPICVNPSHLFLGTHQDNMRDRDSKGRGVVPDNRGENHWTARRRSHA